MRYRSRSVVIFSFAVIAILAIISASKWRPKASLFPLVIGSFVLILSTTELLLTLLWKEKSVEETEVVDFKISEGELANRRTLSISLWIIGFFFLILFLGFSIAIPVFLFLYLTLDGKEKWGISLGLAVLIWICFFGLFVWLLNTPFPEGLLQRALRAI
ncbi:MAG: tripartite tricarboxylate transporter TctB family protein [Deltaproteobacteria bacterium]